MVKRVFAVVVFLFIIFFLLPSYTSQVSAVCTAPSTCRLNAVSCGDMGLCDGLGTCTNGECCKTCPTVAPTVAPTAAPFCSSENNRDCLCGCTPDIYGGYCKPDPYCKASCTCGCSANSCSGGACKPTYCGAWCENGCSQLSCTGGTCNAYCTLENIQGCECGCTGDSWGGYCKPAPYCKASCTCGCSANSCSGGACKPEYCGAWCANGCSSNSCTGGTCNAFCSTENNRDCPCGCTADSWGGYCKTCPPTPTLTPAFTPTLPPVVPTGTACAAFEQGYTKCSGNTLMYCTLSLKWQVQTQCIYSCDGGTGAQKCNNSILNKAVCCPQSIVTCYTDSCESCSPPSGGNAWVKCYTKPLEQGGVYIPPDHCAYKASCVVGCNATSETCGGDANCEYIYPGQGLVSHIDNCNGINCAPPCTAPTPTGGGGGPCTPDCSGSGNVCFGIWYNDPTGCGSCTGSKACSGTLVAESRIITSADTSCTAINASTTVLPGTSFFFTPEVLPLKTQPATGSVNWTNVYTAGNTNYAFSAAPLGQYAQGNVCMSQNNGAWTSVSAGTLTDGGTLSFRVGYVPQMGWFQTTVGNVYAATQLTSSIPTTATNRYLSLVGSGGTAGIASYGTGYDLSLSASDLGESNASPLPAGWLINQINLPIDYYAHFDQKLINETKIVVDPLAGGIPAVRSCSSGPCIYTIAGNTTFSSPITIGATEKIIVLVNTTDGAGTVAVNRNITVTAGGFFALIVNGNITINPIVATLQGIYIATNTSHQARFTSGNGAVQLAVKGSVVADAFTLQRDLGASNTTTPAESFVFDPQLLFTMPDSMKDSPYVWQEVAP